MAVRLKARQGVTKLVILPAAERAALRALRDARSAASLSVSRAELAEMKTLDEALLALGWRTVRGAGGAIRSLEYVAPDYLAEEKELFEALSPCVEPGSSVDLWVEGEAPKRFKFTGRSLVERRLAPESFVPYSDDSDVEPPPSRTFSFADALRLAPSHRRKYSPSERFAAGDWIEHPKFGAGLVQPSDTPGKVKVLFADGEKVLVQAG